MRCVGGVSTERGQRIGARSVGDATKQEKRRAPDRQRGKLPRPGGGREQQKQGQLPYSARDKEADGVKTSGGLGRVKFF